MGAGFKNSMPAFAVMALAIVATAAPAAEYRITIAGMKFGGLADKLHAGDVIVWRNDDIFRHTATARDKSFDVDLPPKSEKRITITAAEAVDFYCRFHPMMKGKLNVQP